MSLRFTPVYFAMILLLFADDASRFCMLPAAADTPLRCRHDDISPFSIFRFRYAMMPKTLIFRASLMLSFIAFSFEFTPRRDIFAIADRHFFSLRAMSLRYAFRFRHACYALL